MTSPKNTTNTAALLWQDHEATDVVTHVQVHPLVLLSILDHHTRRQEGVSRVIGTLLGRRDGNKMEIINCFAVPHAERGDEVAIGKDFNKQMLSLHLRSNKKEVVVGWYATFLETKKPRGIADTSSLIHEFYSTECEEDPIHVVVDTSLQQDSVNIHAFKSTPVQIGGEPLANLFHEIPVSIVSSESERICVYEMIQQQEHNKPIMNKDNDNGKDEDEATTQLQKSDFASLQMAMEQLLAHLETASQYVDRVVDGKIPAQDEVGRSIADTLHTVPRIRPQVFDKLFNDSLQDMLMVTYLSNITRTQLVIADKLNASLAVL
eukprot:CAMPEP_0118697102 /NCGR_PEP_ID=MMETSP0800-20121206/14276_1 /TAXON_ID=210618 ORGANISM="Striatella unipunctata, Strain CCMP2910" /NCGR_SAMPLE_ID=MMETSP0800 /ASSEMBLY_ACC=CAM_ASM_000638 /LENGTH=319 /DNA_ID=CAMNT_0006596409 /DNA_START=18 /DNA_END=977 /DNA_ORIENTATION=+